MKKLILGLVAAIFLMNISLAAAQDAQGLKIDVSPLVRTVNVKQPALFYITGENNLERAESFYMFVAGSPANWINIDTSYVEMPAHSSRNFKLNFYPNDKPGDYDYEVFFQSVSNPNMMVSKKIYLNVIGEGEEKIGVLGHEIWKDAEGVNFKMTLSSRTEKAITMDFSLVSDSGVIIATDTRTSTVEGEKNVTHRIPIHTDIVAGKYTAKVQVKGTDIEFQSYFNIESVHRMVKREEETDTPLFHEVKITIANEGNVIEKDYKVKSQVPTGFLSFSRQPVKCEDDWCEWLVGKLNPEESLQIIYRIEYWPLIVEGLVIAVLLVSFFVFGWNKANAPKLIKKMGGEKGGDYTTVLEIKNAGKKITNVVIRDQVSPLFEVKGKFETVKPAIRQTEDGTELVWSLGAIEPRDHRIIHYNVRPVVNGHLKLPKAYMKYLTAGGKRSKVTSKQTFLAA